MFKTIFNKMFPNASKKSISEIYEDEKLMAKASIAQVQHSPVIKKQPKTIYRWLSDKNIENLVNGYAIGIEVNRQRISLKAKSCQ